MLKYTINTNLGSINAMMQKGKLTDVKVMHTGDVHLDATFSALSFEESVKRRDILSEAFCKCVQEEIDGGVSIVLIAGDLFDIKTPHASTFDRLISLFTGNPNTEFLISAGEHDAESDFFSSKLLPSNVYVFKGPILKKLIYKSLNTQIYGWSFKKDTLTTSPIANKQAEDTDMLKLVVGHCDTNALMSNYCPITEEEISAFGADYFAFAHRHAFEGFRRLGETTYAHCGFFEGHSFSDCGFGGYVIINAKYEEADKKWILDCRRKKVSLTRYEKESIKIDDCRTENDIAKKIIAVIDKKGYDASTILKITLTGSVSKHLPLPTSFPNIADRLYALEIENETYPSTNEVDIENDITADGILYGIFANDINNGSKNKRTASAAALRRAIEALKKG